MIDFVLPRTTGEWLAWSSAVYLVISGLFKILGPTRWLSAQNIKIIDENGLGLAMIRGPLGGGNLGLGLAVMILHPQPFLYIAVGGLFTFIVVGRIVSIVVDRVNNVLNWISLIVEVLLGFSSLAYAFDFIT